MRSSGELALPEGFSVPRRGRLVLLAVTTPVLVLVVLFRLASSVLGADGFGAGGAVLFGAAMVVGFVSVLRDHLRRCWPLDAVRPVPGGLAIAFSRRVVQRRVLGLALLGSALLLWGISAWSSGSTVGALLFTAGGAAGLGYLLRWYLRGIRPGELVLTSDSVHLVMDDVDVEVRWDDVESVHAWEHSDRYRTVLFRRIELPARHARGWRPAPPGGSLWAVTRRSPGIDIHCDRVEIDPVLLYHLLRFYLDHPCARTELAGRTVHARLRDRRFAG